MGSDVSTSNLKMLFFPFMASGHMLPMIDMAKLFAARGVDATVITTPANAPLIRPSIESSCHPIGLHLIPFPSGFGLPEGCESAAALTTPEMRIKFFTALLALRDPFDRLLAEFSPDCVVTDIFFPWTADIAAERGVPRIGFSGSNFFAGCAVDTVDRHKPLDGLPAEAESFVIPGLPHEIKMLKSQLDQTRDTDRMKSELFKRIREAEAKSYGVVVNSFYELEPEYARHYREVIGRKAWHIGPVSLCNGNTVNKSARGDKSSVDTEACLNWLNCRRPGSVVYVCFGSLSDFSAEQIRELAFGLETADHPFIWAVRASNIQDLPEGFEERTEGRGLVIKGWAPQILILNHESVGCFVTHCGWNSSLEGLSAGVPLVTWPLFAEQFFNERLIVDVLRIGVAVGIKKYSRGPEERELVCAGRVEDAVRRMMGDGEAADERRQRARELGEAARRAMEEGGSSYVEMGNLIQELIGRRNARV